MCTKCTCILKPSAVHPSLASHVNSLSFCLSLYPSFSRPPKVIRARRSDEHLPPSKGVSRPSVGGAKRPGAPSSNIASRGGGGGGGRVSDSRGRLGGGAPVGGSRNKSTPSSVAKKPTGKDKVHVHMYVVVGRGKELGCLKLRLPSMFL